MSDQLVETEIWL